MARRLTRVLLAAGMAATLLHGDVRLRAQDLPTLAAPVNDFASVIEPAIESEIDRQIRALQTASSDVVLVVTVKTFAPYASIEEFAIRLFERAGIGTRKLDNGVLIVLALDERRVRIEVGYGLEEFITDGFSGDVIRRDMLPEFRGGRFGQGLLNGTTTVIHRIAERRGIPLDAVPQPQQSRREPDAPPVFMMLIVAALIWMSIVRRFTRPRGGRRGRRGPWGGWTGGVGGFGGGFGGFGGGGFGGGGFGGGGGGFGGFGGGRSGGGGASGGW